MSKHGGNRIGLLIAPTARPSDGKKPLAAREHPLARDERGKNLREDIRRMSTHINPAARGTHITWERSGQVRHHLPRLTARKKA